MLEQGPFRRATAEQLQEDQCCICQETLSSEIQPGTDVKGRYRFRTIVYAITCDKPHLMHSRCALKLIANAGEKNAVPCPLCKREISHMNNSIRYLESLKTYEQKKPVCDLLQEELEQFLARVAESGFQPVHLPQLISLTKRASISEKTPELCDTLCDAQWLLAQAYIDRSPKIASRQEIEDAINALQYCCNYGKAEASEKLHSARLIRLDMLLKEARQNPAQASDKLQLLVKDGYNYDSHPDFKLKKAELTFLKEQHYLSQTTFRSFEHSHHIETLQRVVDAGYQQAAPLLAELCYKDVRTKVRDICKADPVHVFFSIETITRDLQYAIDHGNDDIQKRALKLKEKLPGKYLAAAQRVLQSQRLKTYEVRDVFEYLQFAAEQGNDEVKTEAGSLLDQREALVMKNQALPQEQSGDSESGD